MNVQFIRRIGCVFVSGEDVNRIAQAEHVSREQILKWLPAYAWTDSDIQRTEYVHGPFASEQTLRRMLK